MPSNTGLHKVNFKLASGETATYFYAWRGGPRITDKFSKKPLQPGTKAFKLRFEELLREREFQAKKSSVVTPTVQTLIDKFKLDPDFYGSLGERTKVDYDHYLNLIGAKFGNMKLRAVDERGARSVFLDWRNSMAKTPRKADLAWTMLKRLFNFGLDRQLIIVNPCTGGGKLHSVDRSDMVWPKHILEVAETLAAEKKRLHVWDVVELAAWTGQRKGDLLEIRWDDYDGDFIRVEQNKSKRRGKKGTLVHIPVLPRLKAILERRQARKRPTDYILAPHKGGTDQWTITGFNAVWADFKVELTEALTEQKDKELVAELHFHDLRGTFVLHAAESGCTVPEIAALTGHKLGDVQTILDKYLPKTKGQAKSAMEKLEAHHAKPALALQTVGEL